MHILFTLSRLLLHGDSILEAAKRTSAAPLTTRELEQGMGVDAETVLAKAVPLANRLNSELYQELITHATTLPDDLEYPQALPLQLNSIGEEELDADNEVTEVDGPAIVASGISFSVSDIDQSNDDPPCQHTFSDQND